MIPCQYFRKCGGCSLQQVDYSLQLENKKKKLIQSINFEKVKVFSGPECHYRHRMDFIFHPHGLGLREKGKWFRIVDVKQCPLASPKINQLLKEVNDFFTEVDAFDLEQQRGTFRFAVIRSALSGDSSLSFVLNPASSRVKAAQELIEKFAENTSAENVVVTFVNPQTDESTSEDYFIVKGQDFLQEQLLGKTYYYPIQGFFQNNPALAEKMLSYVLELWSKHPTLEAYLLDLYGGVGTFGLASAERFKKVRIVESVPAAVKLAQKNIAINKINTAEALELDAKNLSKLSWPQPLYVLTDPPRSGMEPQTIKFLQGSKPEVIIYISCNVNQLSKDWKKFTAYRIESAALFDLFPQTNHQEAVVELVLKK